jgi:hypothetical protein
LLSSRRRCCSEIILMTVYLHALYYAPDRAPDFAVALSNNPIRQKGRSPWRTPLVYSRLAPALLVGVDCAQLIFERCLCRG